MSKWTTRLLTDPGTPAGLRAFGCFPWAKTGVLLGFILLAALPLRAQNTLQDLIDADRLSITTTLEPAGETLATQRTRLIIDIATDRWFTGGTKLGELEIRNAIVLQRQSFAVNSTARRDGQTWAQQRWELEIFPHYPGTYQVPPITLDLHISGDSGATVSGRTQTAALEFSARAPAGTPPADTWVVTPKLTLRETWDQPLTELQAGNARKRTLTIEAEELPAMVLPAPAVADIEGLGVYAAAARREDHTNRGDSRGTFTQTITYFCETAGTFVVPAIRIAWWNPNRDSWQLAELPEQILEVAADPNAPVVEAAPAPGFNPRAFGKRFLIITTCLFVVAVTLRWLTRKIRALRQWRKSRHRERGPTEPQRWRELRHALRGNDTLAMVNALYRWRDTLPPASGPKPPRPPGAPERENDSVASLTAALFTAAFGRIPHAFTQQNELARALRTLRPRAQVRWLAKPRKILASTGFTIN